MIDAINYVPFHNLDLIGKKQSFSDDKLLSTVDGVPLTSIENHFLD